LLERAYKEHFTSPTKHPKYRKEWNKFWDVRSAQLKQKGINPDEHDFTEEWRDFFMERLKILKEKDYAKLKNRLFDEYREKESKNGHKTRFSGERYKHRSRSSSSEYSSEKRKKVSNDKKTSAVSSICYELLRLDSYIIINREKIGALLKKSINHERKHNREYLMDKDECIFLKHLVIILRNTLMLKKITRTTSDRIKSICDKMECLVKAWENFMKDQNLHSSISPSSSFESKNVKDIKKNVVKKPMKVDRKDSTASSGYKSGSSEIKPVVNRLEYFVKQMEQKSSTFVKPEPQDYVPEIKQETSEPESQDYLQLLEEKDELLKMIYENSEFPNLIAKSGKIHKTDNAHGNLGKTNDYIVAVQKEASLTAKSISDDELISHLKNLENLTDEKQFCMYQIMIDIEQNDFNRFNRLKNYIYKDDQAM
jgi:hypothetical protein